ncbi:MULTISPECIES: CaiB/BaiF CoA-transferase family protein [Rhodococcus]|uniref:CaiB/BaiF CoA-transferase family protein n=1 Tax=Rhodococcus oxybenzonivorans TaxID=1990687 RepID=A0AAE4V016_9NOCA|nr:MULTISPECIES: CaiB/BaiF CoA-transferase family protein [Rhodococcus]MDV7241877.1 CaiB/BaiF CoA-transferase family protein [Rhodococcus oxybenzonivorans]MDV7265469.1 CaiB/BaiF CoA-transferase family protein [Rhodococcus oxybenzonivorans]MDV7273589.1 CaiB/BaiF CoA-transferase family protein [Rhodococcus oxybenzonivorans]MDV7334159.1 CaiB/BaiF CoA-transferase family protein [Rhodococcus oxybenzonivorans]MDV7343578.1 CaiB/BaiF CoA-transferase family protein [Rhodococcus oxybenzonivorans]
MNDKIETTGPLRGIRILDLSRILAAPLATQLLGDLGAEVIKVERPGVGDDSRQYGPPFFGEPSDRNSGFYLSANRNKQSITVDHSDPRGAALIRELAGSSDVLVENFRTGVLAKYGLDFESLRQHNPRLVYCSVTGFGQDGPYAMRAGYDGVFQAMSGMMSVSGIPDGEPGAGPMKVGVSMVDVLAGLYTSTAILAALRHRDRTDEGQHIDVSLLDCGVASLSHYVQNYLVSGVQAPRRGNGGFGGIPSQAFRCSDGNDIFVVASTPKQFSGLAAALGGPELVDDPRFATVSARIENRDFVLEVLSKIFVTEPVDYWVEKLEAADVPCSPVNSMKEVFDNPQVQHRQLLRRTEEDGLALVGNPIRFSESPVTTYRVPPRLGEHTDAVLRDYLSMSQDEINALRADEVI